MGQPPYEGWVERQIREATERGEFDDLPGAGRPLHGVESSDPDWWVKRMMDREGLDSSDALPPVMQLRREAAGYPQSLADVRHEDDVRELLRDFNRRVLDERRRPTFGRSAPPLAPTVDVEEMVAAWHRLRAQREAVVEEAPPAAPPAPRPWWRRLLRD